MEKGFEQGFGEVKLFRPLEAIGNLGRRAVNFLGVREQAIHQVDHYELSQPVIPECDGGSYPRAEQLQIDFEEQPLGERPLIPAYDADGRYMNNQGIEG